MARIQRRTIKKDLYDPDNHNSGITQLEPYILECEVKWVLRSITTNKASGGDEIPIALFQILKDDATKVLHSICQKIWETQQWSQTKKVSFHSNPKKGPYQRIFKLLHNCTHLTCLQSNAQNSPSQASIIHNCELPNAQAGFSKDRAARDQIANIRWIIGNQESSRKKYLPPLY